MGWLLLFASICLFVPTLLYIAVIGQQVERKDRLGLEAALIMGILLLVASMTLLFMAGLQFGRA